MRSRNAGSAIAPMAPRQPLDAAAAEVDAWAADMRREIPADKLTTGQKNAVWREIKARHPERRAFLEDPVIKGLMAATGAVPTFPPDLIRGALNRQQKDTA